MQKQETCQEFTQDTNVPISKELMAPSTLYNAMASRKPGTSGDVSRLSNTCGSTGRTTGQATFNEQRDISRLTGGTVMSHANAAVDNAQWLLQMLLQMITSLNNLANATVQKTNTVEKLV
ncbi:hypothetical protein ACHAW6_001778, partial [Cyclotella cf. meneghiniana]